MSLSCNRKLVNKMTLEGTYICPRGSNIKVEHWQTIRTGFLRIHHLFSHIGHFSLALVLCSHCRGDIVFSLFHLDGSSCSTGNHGILSGDKYGSGETRWHAAADAECRGLGSKKAGNDEEGGNVIFHFDLCVGCTKWRRDCSNWVVVALEERYWKC